MQDLTGPIVLLVRDNPAVAAITPRVRGGELAAGDAAPAVVIVGASNTRSPFGPGKGRLGLQGPRFYANCYGATYQQATQLAGAVSDALHLVRGRALGGGKVIHQILDGGWGGVVLDPATKWPTETVVIEVTGAA
jgi:hypothetical protein